MAASSRFEKARFLSLSVLPDVRHLCFRIVLRPRAMLLRRDKHANLTERVERLNDDQFPAAEAEGNHRTITADAADEPS